MSNEKRSFEAYEYDINISPGYYDKVLDKGGIQAMWHELKFRNVSDFIQGGSGKSLLDIGCGPGSFSRFLDPQCVYTGTDFSAAQIQYATERYGGDNRDFKVTLAGEPWPFEDASFDYCSALELIEHLNAEEIHGLLSEAARVLRPGGRFLLSTPNYVSLWPLLEMIVNRVSELNYEDQHISRFNLRSIRGVPTTVEPLHIDRVSTMHLFAPFCAGISKGLAYGVNSLETKTRALGVGALIFLVLRKK